jgi:hypothetical protein
MANKINNVPAKRPETETPTVENDTANPAAEEEKKLERSADRAAHKAAKREQEFDSDHTTFSN